MNQQFTNTAHFGSTGLGDTQVSMMDLPADSQV